MGAGGIDLKCNDSWRGNSVLSNNQDYFQITKAGGFSDVSGYTGAQYQLHVIPQCHYRIFP